MKRRARQEGFTLVELLIAMVLSVIILGVVVTAFIVTLKSTKQTRDTLGESHDAQLVAAYLPTDLLSAGGATTDVDTTPGTPTGCAGSPGDNRNVVRLLWSDVFGAASYFAADYRVRQSGEEYQLVRYSCQASSSAGLASTPPDPVLVVAHNLASVGLPTVTVSGDQLSLTVTDVTGYQYVVSGTRRTPIAGSTASATPSPSASPAPETAAVSSVTLNNTDAAGNVNIIATFTKALDAGCSSKFSVTDSAGHRSYAGPATITGATATLALTSATVDTSVTGLAVAMTGETVACTASSFTNSSLTDKAAPVIVNVATTVAGATTGELESGDAVQVTFSEPLTTYPSVTSVNETSPNGNENHQLTLTNVFAAADLGATDYLSKKKKTATFPATSSGSVATLSVTVGSPCSLDCTNLQSGGTSTSVLTFRQADNISDAAGNALTATSPVPTASRMLSGFRAF